VKTEERLRGFINREDRGPTIGYLGGHDWNPIEPTRDDDDGPRFQVCSKCGERESEARLGSAETVLISICYGRKKA